MKMTHIFYSSICRPGRYIDGRGNHVVIKWKAHDAENPLKAASEALFPDDPPPPPEGKFSRIVEPLNRIVTALEGIVSELQKLRKIRRS